MNESVIYNAFTCNKFCRVCLITSNDLIPMSDHHLNLYRNLIENVAIDYEMKTCTNCLWMLQKFHKFKDQCQSANDLLNEMVFMDSKNFNIMQNLTISHHLTKSRIELNYYRPLINDSSHCDNQRLKNCANNYDDSLVNVTDYYHNKSENFTDDYHSKFENFIDGYQIETNDHHDNSDNGTDTYLNKSENFEDDYQVKAVNVTNDYDDKSFNVTNDNENKLANVTNDCNSQINDRNNDRLSILTENNDIIDRLIYSSYNRVVLHENVTQKNDKFDDDTINIVTYENDMHENDDINNEQKNDVNDEDELPLALLRKDGKKNKNKRKRKKMKNEQLNQKRTIEESNTQKPRESVAKLKESEKVVVDGFTSRMVQETDEYTVIKLTKKQVLDEMLERAKTDSYIRSPFKCEKCVKAFNFEDVLQKHLEKHYMKKGSFECEICHQYCPSAVSLKGHIKSHTTRYKCKVCGRVNVARQHLLEHYATMHTGVKPAYTCDRCQFTSDKRTVMQRHVRGHQTREKLSCHACGKLFKNIETLRLHTARHDNSPRFKCDRCDMKFVYHSLLRRHIQCVHERREFYCVECDVQFKTSEILRLHFKRAKKHRDSSSFKHKCDDCDAVFISLASLSSHRSAAHAAPKTHPCPHCQRMYSTRDAVRVHVWRSHARLDARVSCTHCGNSYARKSTLKLHLLTHTGECGNAFAQDKTIQTHVQAKREKEELQQYENKIEV